MVYRCEACHFEADEKDFHNAEGVLVDCPRCHSEDVFDKAETEAMVKAQREVRGSDYDDV